MSAHLLKPVLRSVRSDRFARWSFGTYAVVGPDGAAGPGVGQGHVGGLLGDAEGAVAVVAVERAGALAAGEEQVDRAVVVVVAPGLADAEVSAGEDVVGELGLRTAMRRVDADGFVRLDEESPSQPVPPPLPACPPQLQRPGLSSDLRVASPLFALPCPSPLPHSPLLTRAGAVEPHRFGG